MAEARGVGCLLIGDLLTGEDGLLELTSHLRGRDTRVTVFSHTGAKGLHMELQRAYQRARQGKAVGAIAARGSGCDCALALASQLPVDRLVLIEPVKWRGSGPLARALGAIRRYADQGAAFVVSDVLIVPGPRTSDAFCDHLTNRLCGSRVTVVDGVPELWTNGKERLKTLVSGYLAGGVLPKSLAENAEMCIIYE